MGKVDLLYCGHEIHSLARIHKETKMLLRKYCGFYECFFAFVAGWQFCVEQAEWLPISVWYYLSANARLSCQEIKPTQYTVIAKNYVKFFLFYFINFYFQKRSSTTVFALPVSHASASVLTGPT